MFSEKRNSANILLNQRLLLPHLKLLLMKFRLYSDLCMDHLNFQQLIIRCQHSNANYTKKIFKKIFFLTPPIKILLHS